MLNRRGAQIFAQQYLRTAESQEPITIEPEHFDPQDLANAFEELGCAVHWRDDRKAFTLDLTRPTRLSMLAEPLY